jgi:hypothetical protein
MPIKLCKHNKRKPYCRDCKGGAICDHDRIRYQCRDCKGSQICDHNNIRAKCRECDGVIYCVHDKCKYRCKECKGSEICDHNRRRSSCRDCKGSAYCTHDKQKSRCKECDGKDLCKVPLCETRGQTKYDGYCVRCFVNLFPDKPNSRNYKTKEKAVTDFILEKFPIDKYTWILDRKIEDGCSKRRPDMYLDLGYQIIIIEVDENQHDDYDNICENKRLMLLSQDVGHRPIIFIRFNPDSYETNDGKILSCWEYNKCGLCVIKKKEEWDERLEILREQIEYWCKESSKSEKTIQLVYLFYDIMNL